MGPSIWSTLISKPSPLYEFIFISNECALNFMILIFIHKILFFFLYFYTVIKPGKVTTYLNQNDIIFLF